MYHFLVHQIVKFDYRLKNGILRGGQHLFFRKNLNPRKVLIFRTGSIGDNVCSLPAIAAIKNNFPRASIDILTNAGKKTSINQLIDATFVRRIINYEDIAKRELFQLLKKEKYDLFIELTQYDASFVRQVRNMLWVKALGIKAAFGWYVSQTFLFGKYQEKHLKFINERDRLLNILKRNGLDTASHAIILDKNKEREERIQTLLRHDVAEGKPVIGIVIGSKQERNKWPLRHFKKVIEYFLHKEASILIFGGKEDVEQAKQLRISSGVVDYTGKLTPLETAEAMKHCVLVITNDTGPMHLSYAVGTPVVALFSSRDFPGKWYPPADGVNKVFRTFGIKCSICFTKPCYNNSCMSQIKPELVINAAEEIIRVKHKNLLFI